MGLSDKYRDPKAFAQYLALKVIYRSQHTPRHLMPYCYPYHPKAFAQYLALKVPPCALIPSRHHGILSPYYYPILLLYPVIMTPYHPIVTPITRKPSHSTSLSITTQHTSTCPIIMTPYHAHTLPYHLIITPYPNPILPFYCGCCCCCCCCCLFCCCCYCRCYCCFCYYYVPGLPIPTSAELVRPCCCCCSCCCLFCCCYYY